MRASAICIKSWKLVPSIVWKAAPIENWSITAFFLIFFILLQLSRGQGRLGHHSFSLICCKSSASTCCSVLPCFSTHRLSGPESAQGHLVWAHQSPRGPDDCRRIRTGDTAGAGAGRCARLRRALLLQNGIHKARCSHKSLFLLPGILPNGSSPGSAGIPISVGLKNRAKQSSRWRRNLCYTFS